MWLISLIACIQPDIELLSLQNAPVEIDTLANVDDDGGLIDSVDSVEVISKFEYRISETDNPEDFPIVLFGTYFVEYQIVGDEDVEIPPYKNELTGTLEPGSKPEVVFRANSFTQTDWFADEYNGSPVNTTAKVTFLFTEEGKDPATESFAVSGSFDAIFADFL